MKESLDASFAGQPVLIAEQRISAVLQPGEKLLWSGQPNTALAAEHFRSRLARRRLRNAIVFVVIMAFAGYLLAEDLNIESLQQFLDALSDHSLKYAVIAAALALAIIVLSRFFKLDKVSALSHYLSGLSFGMTNRRLLVLEGNKVVHEFRPEEIGRIRIRQRQDGYGDVILAMSDHTSASEKVQWHKGHGGIGFKAIANADAMKRRIEDWIRDHEKQAGDAVAEFVRDPGAGNLDSTRQVVSAQWGLTVAVPRDWSVKARRRKKPYGKIFLDMERWQAPEPSGDWNVLYIEGPAHTSIEIHVDNCEPVCTRESLTNSVLNNRFGGKLEDSRENLSLGTLNGFSLTRRVNIADGDENSGRAARSVMRRHTVFHGDGRQLVAVSTWPDGSAALQKAVAAVVASIELAG